MALLWVWAGWNDGSPDPMIDNSVGEGKTNMAMDVYLVQALLCVIYSTRRFPRPRDVPLPVPGSGWDVKTFAFVMHFQNTAVRQKVPSGVISPVSPGMSYQTAIAKRYTIAHLIRAARLVRNMFDADDDLVTYLKEQFPALVTSFLTVRKGTTSTTTVPTSENFNSGGNSGMESGPAPI